MAKSKATKGDSKGKPLETVVGDMKGHTNESNAPDLLSVELPKLDIEVAEAVCGEVLRGNYCQIINEYATAEKEKTLDKKDSERILDLLKSFEVIISWLDQSDKWLKDLHSGNLNESK